MADDPRQEVKFSFDGKNYSIRPTFGVLTAIEATLQQPARTIGLKCFAAGLRAADRGNIPEISLSEVAGVMVVLMKDQKDAPPPERIGEILVEDGFSDLLLPLGNFLTRAQKGNKEHMRETIAAEKREKERKEGAAKEGEENPTAAQQTA